MKEQWCLPPDATTDCVWHREDVLAVDTRPDDPRRPHVCRDETSRQRLADVTPPLRPAPGRAVRADDADARAGVVNLFLVCAPLRGWRHVTISDRRTRLDFAHCVRDLVAGHYPDAERMVLVLDNLNTHTRASLAEAFPPAEAKRLTERLAIHDTPKHGRWLNMAELELSVVAAQCLDRRLPDPATMAREVAAWEQARNAASRTLDGRFTTAEARITLNHLYPVIQP